MKKYQKTKRRLSREIVLQSLYAWRVSGSDFQYVLIENFLQNPSLQKADGSYAKLLFEGTSAHWDSLEKRVCCVLEEPFLGLAVIEQCLFCLASYEFFEQKTPKAIVINEAIELSKSFGAPEGHTFLNVMLERIFDLKDDT